MQPERDVQTRGRYGTSADRKSFARADRGEYGDNHHRWYRAVRSLRGRFRLRACSGAPFKSSRAGRGAGARRPVCMRALRLQFREDVHVQGASS